MSDRERKRVPEHRSSCPSQEHGMSEYSRLSEESKKESRDEVSQRGMGSCTRNDVEADESYFVLNPAAVW